MTVSLGSDILLDATVPGRYRQIEFGPHACRLILPPVPDDPQARDLAFPAIAPARIRAASLGGKPVALAAGEGGSVFRLPPTAEPQLFELALA
jgi:hypothetical protein